MEQAELGRADKRLLHNGVSTMMLKATLTPATVGMASHQSSERSYAEIYVIEVTLRVPTVSYSKVRRLATILHTAFPNPVMLDICAEGRHLLSLAHKRKHQGKADAVVLEDMVDTEWIDATVARDRAFLGSLALNLLPHSDMFHFYGALMARVQALHLARHTGVYSIGTTSEERQGQIERLARLRALEEEADSLRRSLKQSTNFQQKMTLHMQLEKVKAALREARGGIVHEY